MYEYARHSDVKDMTALKSIPIENDIIIKSLLQLCNYVKMETINGIFRSFDMYYCKD